MKKSKEALFLTPIAMPLLAGSSSITAVSLISATSGAVHTLIVVGIVMSASAIILCIASVAKLNPKLMLAMEKLAGMVIIMIAVQSLLNGITTYLA